MKKFTYGIGASWVLELQGYAGQKRRVIYTVIASRLKRNIEYYDIELREQGKEVQEIERHERVAAALLNQFPLYRKTIQRASGGLPAHARGSDGSITRR